MSDIVLLDPQSDDELFQYCKSSKNKRALVLGGDRGIFPQTLVVLENLYQYDNYDDYDIIIFSSDITQDEYFLANKLHSSIILFDISKSKIVSRLKGYFCHTRWGVGLSSKFIVYALSEFYESLFFLDSDIIVQGRLKQDIEQLVDSAKEDIFYVSAHGIINRVIQNKKYECACILSTIDKDLANNIKSYAKSNQDLYFRKVRLFNGGVICIKKTFLPRVKGFCNFLNVICSLFDKVTNADGHDSSMPMILLAFDVKVGFLPIKYNYIDFYSKYRWGGGKNIDPIIVHFNFSKLESSDGVTQCLFPQYKYNVCSLINKIKELIKNSDFECADTLKSLQSFISYKKDFIGIDGIDKVRMLNFYKKVLPALVRFLDQSKNFFVEPMESNDFIILFHRLCNKTTRLQLSPYGKCTDPQYCFISFRIRHSVDYTGGQELNANKEFKELVSSFMVLVPHAEIKEDSTTIYLNFSVDMDNLEVALTRFERLLEPFACKLAL